MKSPILLFFLFISVYTQAQVATFDSLDLLKSEIVFFDFGKYELRPEADSSLEVLAKFSAQQENLTIHLTAHTDAIGNTEANLTLSKNRAQAVKSKLIAYGLTDTSLVIQPFGESLPVAENETDEGRQKNRRVTIDIYQKTKLLYLSGQIRDKKSGEGIEAKLLIKRKGKRDSVFTDKSGHFKIPIPDSTAFGLEIYAEGYFFDSRIVRTNAAKQKLLQFSLPKIEKGASIDIKNLYFVGNEARLLERSKRELPKVLKFMQLNPNIKIEIAGHINRPNHPPVSKDSWNFDLSVRRAETVYSYLRRNGIPSERVSYKGYGNYEMRYPRARHEKEQELNRRVEIRVLDTGEIIGKTGEDGY